MVSSSHPSTASEFSLSGQLLVAMPSIGDSRFHRTVIYLCSHSDEGAMGLVINRPADEIAFIDLLRQLKILSDGGQINLPEKAREIQVVHGGPVEPSRGFVLHSIEPEPIAGSVKIDSHIRLSANLDILHAIAKGDGPERVVFALGYAGWGAGQLESEIQQNGWILCPASDDLLFDDEFETKYERALALIGVDLGMLSTDIGRA
ncbi:MAG: YqgE/AlgH family protein [Alphaproteobacteria bacterium]|jgi:putative transcriptional regulator|nr:YqgE/AlgH family protein [Alphaproteobacteria bacterium]